jgi:thioredoxin 1
MKENLSDSNFDEIINNSHVPVVVDFWAEWCGPCKMIGQVLDELNNDYGDKILIGKVNVDEQGSLAMK